MDGFSVVAYARLVLVALVVELTEDVVEPTSILSHIIPILLGFVLEGGELLQEVEAFLAETWQFSNRFA